MTPGGEAGLEILVSERPRTVLYAERLRDGRVAVGTRVVEAGERGGAGELHVLEPTDSLDLASWLAPLVEDAWIETIRERQEEPLRTARELYGGGDAAAERLASEMLREIPPELLARAMILLANSIGPRARERLVERLNATSDPSEEAALRRELADGRETFAYAVAAAGIYDALARGVVSDEADDAPAVVD